MAVSRTSPSSEGPAAVAAAKVAGSLAGSLVGIDASHGLLQGQAELRDLGRSVLRVQPQGLPREPQAEDRLGLVGGHLARRRGLFAGSQAQTTTVSSGNSSRRRCSLQAASVRTWTGVRGWSANGRPVSRAIAACAAARRAGAAPRRGRRERQERHGLPIADRAHRRGRVGRQGGLGAFQHGGQRRDGRGLQPAHVLHQQIVIPARQARPPQRLDQERHRIRPRLPKAADGIVLLLGRTGQLGDRPCDPIRPGRIPSRGRRSGRRSAAWRTAVSPGRYPVAGTNPGHTAPGPRPTSHHRADSSGTSPDTAPPSSPDRCGSGSRRPPRARSGSSAPWRTARGRAAARATEGFFGRLPPRQPPRTPRSPAGRRAGSPGSPTAASSEANPNRSPIAIQVASSCGVFRNFSRYGTACSGWPLRITCIDLYPRSPSAVLGSMGKSTGPFGGAEVGGVAGAVGWAAAGGVASACWAAAAGVAPFGWADGGGSRIRLLGQGRRTHLTPSRARSE